MHVYINDLKNVWIIYIYSKDFNKCPQCFRWLTAPPAACTPAVGGCKWLPRDGISFYSWRGVGMAEHNETSVKFLIFIIIIRF